MKQPILGIDYSTHKIDIVGVMDGKPTFATEKLIRKTEKFEYKHLHNASSFIHGFVKKWVKFGSQPPYIYMEEPFIHSVHKSSVIPMAMMAGVIALGISNAFPKYDVDLLTMVPPPKWKKKVIGKGNVGKSEIKKWVVEELKPSEYKRLVKANVYGSDQDLIDAFCIAKYGEEIRYG